MARKPKSEAAPPPPSSSPKESRIAGLAAELAVELSKSTPLSTAASDGISIRIPGIISTRCPTLDAAIGRGGLPMGRLTVLTGVESAGKTTLACQAAAEAQASGGVALYLDTERKLDLDYAAALGVNLDELLMPPVPPALEGCLELIDKTSKSIRVRAPQAPFLVILDSMNSSRTADEYESEDYSPAGGIAAQARAMSYGLPKLLKEVSGAKVALLFISQVRDAGMGRGVAYKEKVSCGNAPKHYAAVVIELRRKEWLKESEKNVGSIIVASIIKNQVAIPFREATLHLRWGSGFDYQRGLLDRGVELLLLNSSTGGWFEMPFNGENLKWQGMKGFNKLVASRPEVLDYLRAKVQEGHR